MAEGPEKKLPQETAEYYSWLLRIEHADFEKEVMETIIEKWKWKWKWLLRIEHADFEKELIETVSNKSPSLILNEI